MGKVKRIILTLLCFAAMGSNAYPFCFDEAGAEYGINPLILRAIAKVESNFDPRALNQNKNGSYDFGLMQINSSWAPVLGLERWNTLGDACYSVKTGAWILANCMSKYGYSWEAIGCYNSQTPGKRDKYARAVFRQLKLIERQEAGAAPEKNAASTSGSRGDYSRRPYVAVAPEVLRRPPAVAPREQAAAPEPAGAQVAVAPGLASGPDGI
ncbi:MAG TPA: lytic transglycosylase domain-containing protein [Geobacteraceae bacterium]